MKHAALIATAFALALAFAGCGSNTASPDQVAEAANARACDNSGYYIENKLAGSKSVVYDCLFAGSLPKCVTFSGGIASDATSEVELLFSNSINAGKPACLTQRATIERQRAAAARRAKQAAYERALAQDARAAWHRGFTSFYPTSTPYQLPNVYYKWLAPNSFSCADYATDGCWKVEVVTRRGCPNSLSLEMAEYSGKTQIATGYGNSGAVAALTPVDVEIDAEGANAANLTGQITSVVCD